MKNFATASIVSLVLAAGTSAQFMINTPANAVQCQPVLLTWQEGQPPYFLSVVPGGQTGAAAIVDFGELNGTSITWLVNVPTGTSVGLNLRDSTGALAQTAPFTILAGSSDDCLDETLSVSQGTAAPTSAGGGQTTVSIGPTTSAGGSTATSTVSRAQSGTASSSAASSTASNSAAMANGASFGFAGLVGALLAVIAA